MKTYKTDFRFQSLVRKESKKCFSDFEKDWKDYDDWKKIGISVDNLTSTLFHQTELLMDEIRNDFSYETVNIVIDDYNYEFSDNLLEQTIWIKFCEQLKKEFPLITDDFLEGLWDYTIDTQSNLSYYIHSFYTLNHSDYKLHQMFAKCI